MAKTPEELAAEEAVRKLAEKAGAGGPIGPRKGESFGDTVRRWAMPQQTGIPLVDQGNKYFNDLGQTIAPAQPTKPVEPGQFPGVDAGEGGRAAGEAAAIGETARRKMFPWYPSGRGTPGTVMPEGEDFLPYGGEKSQELLQNVYEKGPQEIAGATQHLAQIEQDEGEARGNYWKNEQKRSSDAMDAIKVQQAIHQQAVNDRLAEIEKKTKFYTDDLANRGAFWHSPSNIAAAMGAALMNLWTDDRSLGPKLLNQAIQADLQRRKMVMDTDIGGMRSNLGIYEKIAGDKIGGMVLAEAEAKRVAAMELERLAAQFQGPKAKEKAAIMSKKLMMESMDAYGRLYANVFYNKAHLENPAIAATMKATGQTTPGGWRAFGQTPGVTTAPQSGAKAVPAKVVPMAGATGVAQPAAQNKPSGSPTAETILNEKEAAALDSRFRGASTIVRTGFAEVDRRARRAAGIPEGVDLSDPRIPKQYIDKYNAESAAAEARATDELQKVAPALNEHSSRVSGLRIIQRDMELAKVGAKAAGMDIDQFLESGERAVLGGEFKSKVDNYFDALARAEPGQASKWKMQKQAVQDASARLRQLFAGQINEYYVKHAGAAVTAVEKPRLEAYVGLGGTARQWEGFLDAESRTANGEMNTALSSLSAPARALFFLNMGEETPRLPSQSIPGTK